MKTGKSKNKEMEYEEAPSGTILLYNYKEPFIEFEPETTEFGIGYGYQGVLAEDASSGHIQCHFCGEWFYSLPHHLRKEHNMTASSYKELVGLRNTSVLISERTREKLITNRNPNKMANLQKISRKGTKISKETRRKISESLKAGRSEGQNTTGTCPAQLIDRYRRLCEEKQEVVGQRYCGFTETVVKVFGSWSEFQKCCGYDASKFLTGKAKFEYVHLDIEKVKEVYIQYRCFYNRYPTIKALKNLFRGAIYKRSSPVRVAAYNHIKNLVMNIGAVSLEKKIREIGHKNILNSLEGLRKTPEVRHELRRQEIVGIYQNFIKLHGREPSISDSKRGMFIKTGQIYFYFKNFKECIKYCQRARHTPVNNMSELQLA